MVCGGVGVGGGGVSCLGFCLVWFGGGGCVVFFPNDIKRAARKEKLF